MSVIERLSALQEEYQELTGRPLSNDSSPQITAHNPTTRREYITYLIDYTYNYSQPLFTI